MWIENRYRCEQCCRKQSNFGTEINDCKRGSDLQSILTFRWWLLESFDSPVMRSNDFLSIELGNRIKQGKTRKIKAYIWWFMRFVLFCSNHVTTIAAQFVVLHPRREQNYLLILEIWGRITPAFSDRLYSLVKLRKVDIFQCFWSNCILTTLIWHWFVFI